MCAKEEISICYSSHQQSAKKRKQREELGDQREGVIYQQMGNVYYL